MPIEFPNTNTHDRHRNGPKLLTAIAAFCGAATVPVLAWTLPAPLVLPAICVVATMAAIAVALIAWLAAQRVNTTVGYWDIVGALTFIGVFAALLSDPELALPLLESQRTE